MLPAKKLLVWFDPHFAPLVHAVTPIFDAELFACGSSSAAASAEYSRRFQTPRVTDLRQSILDADVDLLFLATAEALHPDVYQAIVDRHLNAALIQPPFSSLNSAIDYQDDAQLLEIVPTLRRSPGFRAAQDVLHHIGIPHALSLCMQASPAQSTLFARLYDAMDFISFLFKDVESLSATLSGVHDSHTEDLLSLHGSMSLNLRLHNGACASVLVSCDAGTWFRGATVFGPSGCIRMTDSTVHWTDSSGLPVEPGMANPTPVLHELIADQVNRLLSDRESAHSPTDFSKVLSICEAARLSARTNQEEAPRKMLSLHRLP